MPVAGEVHEGTLQLADASDPLVVQPHLVRPHEVVVSNLAVGKTTEQKILNIDMEVTLQVQARLLQVVPVDGLAAVTVEKLERALQLGFCKWMDLLPTCDAFQPSPGELPVHLVGLLHPEADEDGKVIRWIEVIRNHLATGKPWYGLHLQDLQVAVEELHRIYSAMPRLRDGGRPGGHIRRAPQEFVQLAACNLPHGSCDTTDLAEVLRVEVAAKNHRSVAGAIGHRECCEAFHNLRYLTDTKRRLGAVVRILRQVRRQEYQGRSLGPPLEDDHQAAPVSFFATLVVVAIDEVEAPAGDQAELRLPPEDAAPVLRSIARPLVEYHVPTI
mmetsp:Transcript_68397/g.198276  ORF Transcript_68397/g.198276 Transcript_68397/m.198276 type:complete len:329 (+) Transcript_68397:590-1576(+)